MNSDKRIDYLISLQDELRSEVKQRISQRDGFATQFLVGCGTVITIAFLEFSYASFLIWLMPLVTVFYSVQILYSYIIHDNLTRFLRKHVEPELARLLGVKQSHRQNYFWETRCAFDRELSKTKFPGIRKGFFEKIIFIAPIIAAVIFVLFGYYKVDSEGNRIYGDILIWTVTAFGFISYESIALYITLKFRKKNELEILGKRGYINLSKRNDSDRAVFLDRDGTIIVDKVQPKDPSQLEFFDDTFSALRELQDKGYLLIVISNQDGIKQGKLTEEEFKKFNNEMLKQLKDNGVFIDAIYYSPHERDEEGDMSFKPKPGMLFLAAEDFRLDLENCYFIGDQHTDYLAGVRANVKPLFVETGIYREKYNSEREAFFKKYSPHRYKNLTEAQKDIEAII